MTQIRSANIHIIDGCNYNCKFCFSSKRGGGVCSGLPVEDWKDRIADLVENRGIQKINFVGGEPLLYPNLLECVEHAKSVGAVTSIVTNGSLANLKFFEDFRNCLDWLGVSIDSTDDYTEVVLGRHTDGCRHLENAKILSDFAHDYGIGFKLNVMVNRLCMDDDFTQLIRRMDPQRVKFMQITRIPGVNDGSYDDLSITAGTFQDFKERHSSIVLSNGTRPVFEPESLVTGSYLMLDSLGDVRTNSSEGYRTFEYGDFWNNPGEQVVDISKYVDRGGLYDWSCTSRGRADRDE